MVKEKNNDLKQFSLECRNLDLDDINDIKFVVNAWLKGFKVSDAAKDIPYTVYNHYQRLLILYLLTHKDTKILCSQHDPLHKAGFICSESIDNIYVLHYVYVIKSYKQFGLGEKLLELSGYRLDRLRPGIYTHHTWVMPKFSTKYNLQYNPYLLWEINLNGENNEKNTEEV